MIYHIAHNVDWQKGILTGSYRPGSLSKEGFIHCSPVEKILHAANSFYKGLSDLVLLGIDDSKVNNKIVWEDLYNHNFNFPHIYGELNLDAVVNAVDFKCNNEGLFSLPENFT